MFGKRPHENNENPPEVADEGFRRVARLKDLKPGRIKEASVGKTRLALTNVDGQYYAFAAFCPHQAWPLWAGDMRGELVRCYLHRWQFNVRTGENVSPGVPVCLTTYPSRVEGDYLLVSLQPSSKA